MKRVLSLAALCALTAAPAAAQESGAGPSLAPEFVETYGSIELEGTAFAQEPRFDGQTRDNVSVAIRPTLLLEWEDGDVAFTLTPFARLDAADDERTHVDLREAKLDLKSGPWAFTLGADFVFWGRTEALQLVDIINSTDGVEDIDGEEKLGQPMLRAQFFSAENGVFSAYWLPYFREPTFAGESGRLRSGIPVDDDAARYGAGAEEWTQSFALRWEHVFGDFDVGASAFYGLSRDAALEPNRFDGLGRPTSLRPVYDEIAQLGFDGQYTIGPTLWKLEAIARANQLDRNLDQTDYVAVTGGLEYTFFAFQDAPGDLGLLLEGAWDSRGEDALTSFEEDAIYGVRYAFNDPEDTQILVFGATDVVSGGTSLRLEAERRLFESWKGEIEGQAFLNPQDDEIESDLRDDSFIRLKLSYFW